MNTDTSTSEQADFIRTQLAFAAHIRDPGGTPVPEGIETRRMAIYCELFYNNVEGFVSSGFPVLRTLYDDRAWHAMVREFLVRHRCRTPYFLEISQEFLAFLQNERKDPSDPPFLLELAHYEWVELALNIAEGTHAPEGVDPNGDLMRGRPVLSSLAWPLSYQYPVQHIGPDYRPDQPGEQPTHLVVYRDRDDEVHFMEINAVTHRLLTLLDDDRGGTGESVLRMIADELNHPDPRAVIRAGQDLLDDLRRRGILLGAR